MEAQALPSRRLLLAWPSREDTTFPELTPFGRAFKLNGYAFSNKKIKENGKGKESPLSLLEEIPLTIDLRGSLAAMNKKEPGNTNGNVEVPQQVNFFFAGAISDHAGGYVQMTYGVQADHWSFDHSDIRYANNTKLAGKNFVYGVDYNNNPSEEDLWQSTPAYGFPWSAPDNVQFPMTATLVDSLWSSATGTNGPGTLQPGNGAGRSLDSNAPPV